MTKYIVVKCVEREMHLLCNENEEKIFSSPEEAQKCMVDNFISDVTDDGYNIDENNLNEFLEEYENICSISSDYMSAWTNTNKDNNTDWAIFAVN